MALTENVIALRKQYVTILDEIYKLESLTSALDCPSELVREGANANEILIPKMDMSGLADYDRNSGFADGFVSLEYETKKCEYDRGKMFTVDSMDNIETAGIAFGMLSGEFLRTKVVPELDAFRFAKYAANAGNVVSADLADGAAAIAALRAARTYIFNKEAKVGTCYLFITDALHGAIDDLDTTKSRKAFEGWAGVIDVPTERFYSAVTLGDDGFTTADGAVPINFLCVPKEAVIQYQKHTVSKVITPEANQTADAWKFGYRTVGICEAYDNKKTAIYAHTATAA